VRFPAWVRYLAIGALAIGAYFLLPTGGVHQGVLYLVIGAASVTAVVLGTRAHKPDRRTGWYLIAAGQAAFVLADVIWYAYAFLVEGGTPFPSFADILYLAGYPLTALGLLELMRFSRRISERDGVIDAGIIAAGVGLLAWQFLMAPVVTDSSQTVFARLISVAYPVMDVLLLAVAARVAFAPGIRTPAYRIIMLALVGSLVADGAYSVVSLDGGYYDGHLLDAGWLLSYVLFGVAALHPAMRRLSERFSDDVPTLSRHRLALLTGALLLAPAVLALRATMGWEVDVAALAIGSSLLFLLVVMRMRGLVRRLESSARALRGRGEELQLANEVKDLFLTAVSHELRTPLSVVLGASSTLELDEGALSREDRRDILDSLGRNARKLDTLVSDLLDLDRLTRGLVKVDRRPLDLGALLREVLEESQAGRERTVNVETDGARVAADVSMIRRLVENLLANAVRHTAPGTPIWLRARSAGGGALIMVEDAGPGVPDVEKEKIFQAFQQGEDAPAHSPGVGVGLSLVARFAELHGGRAWVEDRRGGGASFRVFLPAGAAAEAPSMSGASP